MNLSNKEFIKLLKTRTPNQMFKMFMNGTIRLNEQQIQCLIEIREEQREYEKRENEKINE